LDSGGNQYTKIIRGIYFNYIIKKLKFPSNNTIRNVDTLSKFKSELKKIDETANHAVPKHYFYGPRKLNIILTQKLKFPSLPSHR
jgi:hypothetical protein